MSVVSNCNTTNDPSEIEPPGTARLSDSGVSRPAGPAARAASAGTRGRFLGLLAGLVLLAAWRLAALSSAGIGLHFDEAQYWVWSTDPAFGYYSKPPMIAWLILGARTVCGDGDACIRLVPALAYCGAAVFVFLAARELFDERIGLLAAAAFACIPGVAVSGGFATTDAPLMLAWAFGFWAYVRAWRTDRLADWASVGLALGLGMLSKYTMAAFALSAAGALVLRRGGMVRLKRPGPWLAAAIAVLVFSPNLAWNAVNGFPTLIHTHEISQLERAGLRPARLAEFVAGQLLVLGPLLAWAGWHSWRVLRRRPAYAADRDVWWLLGWFSLPLLGLACAQALMARANVNWALPAFVAVVIAVVALAQRVGSSRLLAGAIVLNVALLAIVLHWPTWARLAGIAPGSRADLFARFYGWHALAERIGPLVPPDAILVNDDRQATSVLAWHLGLPMSRLAAWNPSGQRDHHYRWFVDLASVAARAHAAGRDPVYLVALAGSASPGLVASFTRMDFVGAVPGRGCNGCPPSYNLWVASGFRGYQ